MLSREAGDLRMETWRLALAPMYPEGERVDKGTAGLGNVF